MECYEGQECGDGEIFAKVDGDEWMCQPQNECQDDQWFEEEENMCINMLPECPMDEMFTMCNMCASIHKMNPQWDDFSQEMQWMPTGMDVCVDCVEGYSAEEGQCFLSCCDYHSRGFDAYCEESEIW